MIYWSVTLLHPLAYIAKLFNMGMGGGGQEPLRPPNEPKLFCINMILMIITLIIIIMIIIIIVTISYYHINNNIKVHRSAQIKVY